MLPADPGRTGSSAAYGRFVERFPTPAACAAAAPADVVRGVGAASGTTVGPRACTRRRSPSSSGTAATCPATSTPLLGAARRRGLHRPRRARLRLRGRRRRRRHQRRPGAGPGRGRPAARGRPRPRRWPTRLVPPGRSWAFEPVAHRPRRPALHGRGARTCGRLPAAGRTAPGRPGTARSRTRPPARPRRRGRRPRFEGSDRQGRGRLRRRLAAPIGRPGRRAGCRRMARRSRASPTGGRGARRRRPRPLVPAASSSSRDGVGSRQRARLRRVVVSRRGSGGCGR